MNTIYIQETKQNSGSNTPPHTQPLNVAEKSVKWTKVMRNSVTKNNRSTKQSLTQTHI